MSDGRQVVDVLNAITGLGVGVSLDDFGTGYSALAYLRQLSVNEIKIDRSFVATMIENATASAIVASTISLAADLGISVVAEGVERGEELELLRSFGCSLVQGYYFSRPLPPADLVRWMDGRALPHGLGGHRRGLRPARRAPRLPMPRPSRARNTSGARARQGLGTGLPHLSEYPPHSRVRLGFADERDPVRPARLAPRSRRTADARAQGDRLQERRSAPAHVEDRHPARAALPGRPCPGDEGRRAQDPGDRFDRA